MLKKILIATNIIISCSAQAADDSHIPHEAVNELRNKSNLCFQKQIDSAYKFSLTDNPKSNSLLNPEENKKSAENLANQLLNFYFPADEIFNEIEIKQINDKLESIIYEIGLYRRIHEVDGVLQGYWLCLSQHYVNSKSDGFLNDHLETLPVFYVDSTEIPILRNEYSRYFQKQINSAYAFSMQDHENERKIPSTNVFSRKEKQYSINILKSENEKTSAEESIQKLLNFYFPSSEIITESEATKINKIFGAIASHLNKRKHIYEIDGYLKGYLEALIDAQKSGWVYSPSK